MSARADVHTAATRYPGASVPVIVRRSGYSMRTVRRELTALRADGLVHTDRRGHWSPATGRAPLTEAVTVCVRLGEWWAPVTLYPARAPELGQAYRGNVRAEPPADVAHALLTTARTR